MRQLDRQIGSQPYERLALSRNKAALLKKAGAALPGDVLTSEEAIRDAFVLEFLDLKDEYSESDLEAALLERLTDFLLELGDDFASSAGSDVCGLTTRGFGSIWCSSTGGCDAL